MRKFGLRSNVYDTMRIYRKTKDIIERATGKKIIVGVKHAATNSSEIFSGGAARRAQHDKTADDIG